MILYTVAHSIAVKQVNNSEAYTTAQFDKFK